MLDNGNFYNSLFTQSVSVGKFERIITIAIKYFFKGIRNANLFKEKMVFKYYCASLAGKVSNSYFSEAMDSIEPDTDSTKSIIKKVLSLNPDISEVEEREIRTRHQNYLELLNKTV